MAKILFWNLNKQDLAEEITALCRENDIDLLVLAESAIPPAKLLSTLNKGVKRKYFAPYNPSRRIDFFLRYPVNCLRLLRDEGRVAVRLFKPPVGPDVIIVAVHLPSKLHKSEVEQAFSAIRLRRLIEEIEAKVGHERTVVLGDFNMNPFDLGLVAADALHAVMDREIARKRKRLADGVCRKFFYNPMWSRMGDSSPGPPGTYYYYRGGNVSYFWNTFDQVLIRPDLLDCFSINELRVVRSIDKNSVHLEHDGNDLKSDHFPLIFSLNIE